MDNNSSPLCKNPVSSDVNCQDFCPVGLVSSSRLAGLRSLIDDYHLQVLTLNVEVRVVIEQEKKQINYDHRIKEFDINDNE